MQSTKNIIGLLCAIIAITMSHSVYAEESLYVISYMDYGKLEAYEIDGDDLIWQDDGYTALHDNPVGITIHESDYGKWLFCTSEGSDKIELIDAETLVSDSIIAVPNAYDLAGIAMDTGKSKLYIVDRYTNRLWSYSWEPSAKTLTPDFDDPYYIELEDLECEPNYYKKGAFGIALDELSGLLYVANNTNGIAYYNTGDWSKAGEVNVPCNAISVAVDSGRGLLYFGSMGDSYGDGDPNLYQYNLSTDQINSVNVGSDGSVAGIAVDQQTNFVYITTYFYGYGGDLMIYDSDLNQHGTPIFLESPAGLCVPYNPLEIPPSLADIYPNEPDGIVNFLDFAVLAASWLTSAGDSDYNDVVDFVADDVIDYKDLDVLCSDWLWVAGWLWEDYGIAAGGELIMTGGDEDRCLAASGTEAIDMSVGVMPSVEPMVVSEPEPADIDEILDWLDEVWLSGDIADIMTEEEFLAFRNSIEGSAGY